MKKFAPLAVLAVAATAAASLKDPAEVAREWNQVVTSAPPAVTENLSLRQQSVASPAPRAVVPAPFERPAPRPRRQEPLYDAPGYTVPEILPDHLPPGAKPWLYHGQTYWILPLMPAARKIP